MKQAPSAELLLVKNLYELVGSLKFLYGIIIDAFPIFGLSWKSYSVRLFKGKISQRRKTCPVIFFLLIELKRSVLVLVLLYTVSLNIFLYVLIVH